MANYNFNVEEYELKTPIFFCGCGRKYLITRKSQEECLICLQEKRIDHFFPLLDEIAYGQRNMGTFKKK